MKYTDEQQAEAYNWNLRTAIRETDEARGRFERARSSNGKNKAQNDWDNAWMRQLRKFFIGEKRNAGDRMPQLTLDEFMSWEEAVSSGKLLDWNASVPATA